MCRRVRRWHARRVGKIGGQISGWLEEAEYLASKVCLIFHGPWLLFDLVNLINQG